MSEKLNISPEISKDHPAETPPSEGAAHAPGEPAQEAKRLRAEITEKKAEAEALRREAEEVKARTREEELVTAVRQALSSAGCVKPELVARLCLSENTFRLEDGVLKVTDTAKEIDTELAIAKVKTEVPELFKEPQSSPEPLTRYERWREDIGKIR